MDNLIITSTSFDAQVAGGYLMMKLTPMGVTKHINFDFKASDQLTKVYSEIGNRPLNIYLLGVGQVWKANQADFNLFLTNVKNRTQDIKIYSYNRFGNLDDSNIAEYIINEVSDPETMVFSQVGLAMGDTHAYELGKAYLKWDTTAEEFNSLVNLHEIYSLFYKGALVDNYTSYFNVSNTNFNGIVPIFDFADSGVSNLLEARKQNIEQPQIDKTISKMSLTSTLIKGQMYTLVEANGYESQLAEAIWKTPHYETTNIIMVSFASYGARFTVRTPENSPVSALKVAQAFNKDKAVGNEHASFTIGFYKALDTMLSSVREAVSNGDI